MARLINRLKALDVSRAGEGFHPDGGGLALQVTPAGSRSWVFRYTLSGKERRMGLGATHTVSLSEARERARQLRQQLLAGVDPSAAKEAARGVLARQAVTFDQAVEKYIKAKGGEWKNDKHRQQWENTLATYASPVLGSMDVAQVSTTHILEVLEPIWSTKTETATRLRQRISKVLDWAKTAGHRAGENPARWAGHLEHLLAKPSAVGKVDNHPSLPWTRAADFMAALRKEQGQGSLALQLALLTATRSGEVRGAVWSEFDLVAKIWTIPAERMKAEVEHTVPLTDAAIRVLQQVTRNPATDLVFHSIRKKKSVSLSDMTLTAVIRRMNDAGGGWVAPDGRGVVPHGFRSTFRTWAGEATSHPREVAEHALAHRLPDKVEAAYQRGTLLPKRMALMADWAAFLEQSAKVPA
ncbi:MAG: integrase arm-type DNA-binding domain-containing protein [Rhodoferax sp.]|nr:integrase arm-type DNA-binding domain-containing protein [Rhodoferax sp.]